MRIHRDQRRIRGDQRGLGFRDERRVAGEIDEINFNSFGPCRVSAGSGPFGISEAGLNRDFPGDFFFVPVGRSAAFRNLSPARGHPRSEEQRRHQLRLAGAAVADNANVSYVLGEIALHIDLPLRGPGDAGANRRGSVPKNSGAGLRLGVRFRS
jgi:hypothetical protein